MDFKESAYKILKKEKRPLSVKELTQIALKEGLITSYGKTPIASMGAMIYTDIKQRKGKSIFVKVKRGLFGLKELNYKEKVETINIPSKADLIIERLKETQLNSDSPNDFEEAIKNAFKFLGFEGELIGGSGDTDVLLTANIGQESFKVNVDGKTSKSGKIIDRQIDWISLRDHKRKNKADFVVVVGPSFSGGNLEDRANEHDVFLLKAEDLIKLITAHNKFPFTLTELKDLFAGKGNRGSQLEDLLAQNLSRRNLLEQFRVIIGEIQSIQDRLGYFTFDSLAGREKISELDIKPEDIEYIITLLKLPFINGISQISENKYILTIKINDIANIFQQIANLIIKPEEKEELHSLPAAETQENLILERKSGSKYFNWHLQEHSVVAIARKDNPYEHYCPIDHFLTISEKIIEAFKNQNVINTDLIFSMLETQNLSPNRPFKGKPEEYKIRMTFGIFEIEKLIEWTGSKRPIEYKLNVPIEKIEEWIHKNIKKSK